MEVSRFDYALPDELIAQTPAEPRDASRLLVLHRGSGTLEHRIFRELAEYVRPGDVLVFNDTRVMPARLFARRRPQGGRVEVLLLHRLDGGSSGNPSGGLLRNGPPGGGGSPSGPEVRSPAAPGADDRQRWKVLVRPGRRAPVGQLLEFGGGKLVGRVLARTDEGGRVVELESPGGEPVGLILRRLGSVPLPPYIRRPLQDPERYQTVYARAEGSAAAPTAGLHFTPQLLQRLSERGAEQVYLTLHVGVGTFRPVRSRTVEEHRMHAEYYTIPPAAAEAVNRARRKGGRVWAVGTTVVRALESAAGPDGSVAPGSGWTELFIYPGYAFRAVDVLVTNFHLPRSTLLMLVCAFGGTEQVLSAYREAVARRYRFYSFGDAMLILP